MHVFARGLRHWLTPPQIFTLALAGVYAPLLSSGCVQRSVEPPAAASRPTVEAVPIPEQPIPEQQGLQQPLGPAVDQVGNEQEAPLAASGVEASSLRDECSRLGSDIVKHLPKHPDAWEVKARFHFLFGQMQLAADSWQTALDLAPGYVYALQGLARIANLNGDYGQAIKLLELPESRTWDNAEATYVLADSYLKAARLEESSHTLRQFLAKHPDNYLTWVLLGQCCLAQAKLQEAEQAFSRALEFQPNFPQAQLGLGTVLLRKGDREGAQRLLAEQRRHRDQMQQSGQLSLGTEYEQCAERWLLAARVYRGAELWQPALETARRAVELNPASGEAVELLVDLLERQGSVTEAAEAMRKHMAQLASSATAPWHLRLGVLLAKHGLLEQARSAFLDLTRVAPGDPQGPESVVRLSIRLGVELPQTIQLAERVVELRGTAADHELLAQAYVVNSQWDNAHRSLAEAIRLAPANADYAHAMRQLEQAMPRAR